MEHVYHECDREDCRVCDGGLAWCTVCGGGEGELLPTCPGRLLTPEEHQENYRKAVR